MLRQYQEIKQRHPGTLLFFRLGDFYELFYEDAILGAKELEITLTARHKERGDPVPMCGVPHASINGHVARLIRKGYRVALCDQVEEAGTAKKLVRRDVVRVITPGTAVENQLLEATENRYLAAVSGYGEAAACAFLELSTGDFRATEFTGEDCWDAVVEQVGTYNVRELLCPAGLEPRLREVLAPAAPTGDPDLDPRRTRLQGTDITLTTREDWQFNLEHCEERLKRHFGVAALDGFGLEDRHYATCAAGAILQYVHETQKSQSAHIAGISFYQPTAHMLLDRTTRRNLELTEGPGGASGHTLFGVLNETRTAMGGRRLQEWMLRPSLDLGEINARLDAVGELRKRTMLRDPVRETLRQVQDLQRLIARINLDSNNPRDLLALRSSLDLVPGIKSALVDAASSLLLNLSGNMDELDDVRGLVARAIADSAPANAADGGVIRAGFHLELDELRQIAGTSKSHIAGMERSERERTGIPSLKVRYNQVFGYYIEVSKANLRLVPSDYDRKQTLVGAERYITPELKEYEAKVLGAEQEMLDLEGSLFRDVRTKVAAETIRIQTTATALASLDALASLAETAARRNYVRPELREDDEILVLEGRHPVVEAGQGRFTPNDLSLNNSTDRILIITGPNMAGKTVYLRQAAVIVIMAQMGSWVPAKRARLGLVDRIFTRVGASDHIGRGRSTFMVEMIETANILNTATPRSLVLLDEVGRGTATFDGLSIAWAVAEYLHDHPEHAAKTLFATHYHEMTELEKLLPGVRNYQAAVKETDQGIVFLHRIVAGCASKSYGIEVARLAGLPPSVIDRAREILANLEANELDPAGRPKLAVHLPSRGPGWKHQPSLFERANEEVVEELRTAAFETLTPEHALALLERLKSRLF
ncbi:MAG: DNA mismatch repair protein MutS [Acidobacteria bacterium]|nr:DNA mismatch repair protein MutS [Acidobacteriota bacterium]